jgi:hypothetical protein
VRPVSPAPLPSEGSFHSAKSTTKYNGQVRAASGRGGTGLPPGAWCARSGRLLLAAWLQLEQAIGAVLYGTDDAREGIAAFVAKRKPRFGGH